MSLQNNINIDIPKTFFFFSSERQHIKNVFYIIKQKKIYCITVNLTEAYSTRETKILIWMKLNTLKNVGIYQTHNTGRS